MRNLSISFEILPTGAHVPVGCKKSSVHLIWDLKMDFALKACCVKDGHHTPEPKQPNYSGVVSRDIVRTALTYAALNDVDVTAADIQNAYFQATSYGKHYVICGKEFGLEHEGKISLIRRLIYGGKLAGRDLWNHLRSCMNFLGFKSCQADPNICKREATKTDGTD